MSRGVAAAGPAGAGGALSVSNRTLSSTVCIPDAPAPTEPRDALAVKTAVAPEKRRYPTAYAGAALARAREEN